MRRVWWLGLCLLVVGTGVLEQVASVWAGPSIDVSGIAWYDDNKNGTFDPGEETASKAAIELWFGGPGTHDQRSVARVNSGDGGRFEVAFEPITGRVPNLRATALRPGYPFYPESRANYGGTIFLPTIGSGPIAVNLPLRPYEGVLERLPPGATLDFPFAGGHFFTQTNRLVGGSALGFAVIDEMGVRFWAEFQRLGGVEGVGYPISQRFVWDGFVSQAFQKMVFQWRPEEGRVYAVNVIDLMHGRGLDDWLRTNRATPPLADWSADAGRSWPAIIAAHQALLTDPDIRAAYFAVDDPVTLYGLPMAPIQDMGNVLVLRAQRGILQKWLVDTPWAKSGQVTIANSGDVAKEAGLLPVEALLPQSP